MINFLIGMAIGLVFGAGLVLMVVVAKYEETR